MALKKAVLDCNTILRSESNLRAVYYLIIFTFIIPSLHNIWYTPFYRVALSKNLSLLEKQ